MAKVSACGAAIRGRKRCDLPSQQVPWSVPTTHGLPAQYLVAALFLSVYPVSHVSESHVSRAEGR